MSVKEKAEELVNKFREFTDGTDPETDGYSPNIEKYNGKQCALIAVDEIIDALAEYDDRNNTYELQNMDRDFNYWQQVKSELQSL